MKLKQHIPTKTHTRGHILDLFITREDDSLDLDMFTMTHLLDHYPIHYDLNLNKPISKKVLRKCRKLNSVDGIILASDVEAMLSSTSQNDLACNFDILPSYFCCYG